MQTFLEDHFKKLPPSKKTKATRKPRASEPVASSSRTTTVASRATPSTERPPRRKRKAASPDVSPGPTKKPAAKTSRLSEPATVVSDESDSDHASRSRRRLKRRRVTEPPLASLDYPGSPDETIRPPGPIDCAPSPHHSSPPTTPSNSPRRNKSPVEIDPDYDSDVVESSQTQLLVSPFRSYRIRDDESSPITPLRVQMALKPTTDLPKRVSTQSREDHALASIQLDDAPGPAHYSNSSFSGIPLPRTPSRASSLVPSSQTPETLRLSFSLFPVSPVRSPNKQAPPLVGINLPGPSPKPRRPRPGALGAPQFHHSPTTTPKKTARFMVEEDVNKEDDDDDFVPSSQSQYDLDFDLSSLFHDHSQPNVLVQAPPTTLDLGSQTQMGGNTLAPGDPGAMTQGVGGEASYIDDESQDRSRIAVRYNSSNQVKEYRLASQSLYEDPEEMYEDHAGNGKLALSPAKKPTGARGMAPPPSPSPSTASGKASERVFSRTDTMNSTTSANSRSSQLTRSDSSADGSLPADIKAMLSDSYDISLIHDL